jgi:hypothetical protein
MGNERKDYFYCYRCINRELSVVDKPCAECLRRDEKINSGNYFDFFSPKKKIGRPRTRTYKIIKGIEKVKCSEPECDRFISTFRYYCNEHSKKYKSKELT